MGQSISLIVSKETNLKVPNKIPHIIENNLLLISLITDEFSCFVKRVLRSQVTDIFYYLEDFEFIKVLSSLNIKTFLAYHESDWGGIPIDSIVFAVSNNEIIIESIDSLAIDEDEDPFLLIPEEKINVYDFLEINMNHIICYLSSSDFFEKYKSLNKIS